MNSEIVRAGVILRTENFDNCVSFYRDKLELQIWYTKPQLVCFQIGSGYLMVEGGGHSSPIRKQSNQSPHILRFDVPDVRASAAKLQAHGVEVEVLEMEWGTIGAFADPDGNPCEFKNANDPFFT